MLTIIAAVAENMALGCNNQLLWHLPDDFKRFKQITTGHNVIMGRKTFESLGKKALPKRTNIVISHNKIYECSCVILVNSLQKALQVAYQNDANPFIIGGSSIYKEAISIADRLDLTIVHASFADADTFFPNIDLTIWEEKSRDFHQKDENHAYDFSFVIYVRKSKR